MLGKGCDHCNATWPKGRGERSPVFHLIVVGNHEVQDRSVMPDVVGAIGHPVSEIALNKDGDIGLCVQAPPNIIEGGACYIEQRHVIDALRQQVVDKCARSCSNIEDARRRRCMIEHKVER